MEAEVSAAVARAADLDPIDVQLRHVPAFLDTLPPLEQFAATKLLTCEAAAVVLLLLSVVLVQLQAQGGGLMAGSVGVACALVAVAPCLQLQPTLDAMQMPC